MKIMVNDAKEVSWTQIRKDGKETKKSKVFANEEEAYAYAEKINKWPSTLFYPSVRTVKAEIETEIGKQERCFVLLTKENDWQPSGFYDITVFGHSEEEIEDNYENYIHKNFTSKGIDVDDERWGEIERLDEYDMDDYENRAVNGVLERD